jgi:hypothetical protein
MTFACLLQAEGDGVVGGGVAGVQRGDDVDARGQFTGLGGVGHAEVQEAHAVEAQARGQLTRLLHQFGPGLDAVDMAGLQRLEVQVVDDEAEVGLARAVVGQREAALARLRCLQLLQDFFNELEQVVDLLELAPRILVELALAREDVQLLEQFDRLAGADFRGQGQGGGGPAAGFFFVMD